MAGLDLIAGKALKYHNWQPADGDTIVHTGPCILGSIIVNDHATTEGVLIIRDGITTGGTQIAALRLEISTATEFKPYVLSFDCAMSTGTFLDADGTLAGGDITVTYI